MSQPVLARTRDELAAALAPLRRQGTVALVPTMGALHAGHRSLLEVAAGRAASTVVSIFVNPLQFGAGEDLDRYPRAFDADLAMCADTGVRVVFAPSVEEMYPHPQQVTVHAGPQGERLEGAVRPGHFDGVLTVVAKLFALVRPDVAVFGEKDYQQLVLVRRMVADLALGVDVVAAPTVREPDGLALSSRNSYLSAGEREAAQALSAALEAGASVGSAGPAAVLGSARSTLKSAGVEPDYLVLVDPESLEDAGESLRRARLLVAARIGATRLIDNTEVAL